jgi:hypothetical protein
VQPTKQKPAPPSLIGPLPFKPLRKAVRGRDYGGDYPPNLNHDLLKRSADLLKPGVYHDGHRVVVVSEITRSEIRLLASPKALLREIGKVLVRHELGELLHVPKAAGLAATAVELAIASAIAAEVGKLLHGAERKSNERALANPNTLFRVDIVLPVHTTAVPAPLQGLGTGIQAGKTLGAPQAYINWIRLPSVRPTHAKSPLRA